MHTHAARTGTVRRSHPRHSRHISANPLPVSRAHTPQGPCAAPAVDTITPHTHGTDTISHAWYGDDAPRPLSTVHVAWYGDDAPRPFTTGHAATSAGISDPIASPSMAPHAPPGERVRGPGRPPTRVLHGSRAAGKWRRPPLWYGSCYGPCRIECGGGAAL